MNISTVNALYQKVLETSNGVMRVNVDLHVHTPASRDFAYKPLQKDAAYLNILDEAIAHDIRIIAITDHNTFEGIRYLKQLLQSYEYCEKYKNLVVLCGIEITCFSKHLIAIFPDSFDEKQQNRFLDEIGIDESVRGSEDALADNLGPALLLDKIGSYNGFAILAHADANKGFLQILCHQKSSPGDLDFSGKSLAKIVKHKVVLGLQCNSDNNATTLRKKLTNKDFLRDISPLAYIKCSDCHGVCIDNKYNGVSGQPIGSYYSKIKLSELSFDSLKMALLDSEMRVCDQAQDNHMYIEGAAVRSPIFSNNNEYAVFHFSNELNCIIGSRGTGKTTLLEIVQSIIMPNSLRGKELTQAFSKYSSAIVFLRSNDMVFALTAEPRKNTDSYTGKVSYNPQLKIYKKGITVSQFSLHKKEDKVEFLEMFLTAGYQQRQLFDYSRNPDKILEIVDDFINWKHHDAYKNTTSQIAYQEAALDNLLKNIKKSCRLTGTNFWEYVDTHGFVSPIVGYISRINDQKTVLTKMREKMVTELNSVLVGKVQLELNCKISDPDWKSNMRFISQQASHLAGKTYKYEQSIYECLEKAYVCSSFAGRFDFWCLLLQEKLSEIRQLYKMPDKITDEDFLRLRSLIEEEHIQTFIDDSLCLKYNINAGTQYDEHFKDNRQISMGQNAVALLLLILNAAYSMSDTRPLLMDQPEDDLDNSYIYSTLVREFRMSKQKRQVIISTHNPNIPVAADAESILVLRFNGIHGYLSECGAIDSQSTANAVLEIMEGGHEAIKRRMDKYNTRYFNQLNKLGQ